MKKETKLKLAVYGGNLAGGFVGVGNPIAAAVYGGLDLARNVFSIKNNKYIRLAETAGALFYTGKTIADAVSVVFNGDLASLVHIPFDFGMAYETGMSTWKDYNGLSWSKLKKDAIDVKNDFVGGANSIEKLVDKDSTKPAKRTYRKK